MTVGSAVIQPGKSTTFLFPYAMHQGMGGKHHFEIRLQTNDPANKELVFQIYANSLE